MFEITNFVFFLCSIFVFIISLIILYVLWYNGKDLTSEKYLIAFLATMFGPLTIMGVLFVTVVALIVFIFSSILEKLEIKGRKINR